MTVTKIDIIIPLTADTQYIITEELNILWHCYAPKIDDSKTWEELAS